MVATQLTNDPCIDHNGDMLEYVVAPNGGKHGYEFADFVILEETTNVGVVAAQSAPPRKDIPEIAKAANGAIVSIIMSDKDGHAIAQGSGFLISKDGVILTNYHVIAEGSSAVVKFPDGAFYVVDGVLASDKARDIAVIKAHGQNRSLSDTPARQFGPSPSWRRCCCHWQSSVARIDCLKRHS